VDFDIVASQYLSSGGSEILGGEPSIVAYYQTSFVELVLLEVFCYRLSTDAHVIEGEILGDNAPPPIGTKFNRISHNSLLSPVRL
jgi:hypothetical protein